jgi:hypothetical protein
VVIQAGQVKFDIESQDPFVATKGFLVRNIYICKLDSRKSPKKITRKTGDTFMVSGEFWFILEGTDRVQNRRRATFLAIRETSFTFRSRPGIEPMIAEPVRPHVCS